MMSTVIDVTRKFKKKIVLLGDGAVGKTSLIRRFVFDSFEDKYLTTMGVKVTKKELKTQFHGEDVELTMMIWDIMGQQSYHHIIDSKIKDAQAALLVCDVTRKNTLYSVEKNWYPKIQQCPRKIPALILANKSDLLYDLQFDQREMQALVANSEEVVAIARTLGLPYYSTSAKTGENVDTAFQTIGRAILKQVMI